ncbi:UbiA prenyltransferase family [Whalleya microplaca]|nr:UbiA prenyltransferase family [Whalleya microplaca]
MRPAPINSVLRRIQSSTCLSHAYSIWLFTFSDLKTIVVPQTIFGILNALALSLDQQGPLKWLKILLRLPAVAFVVWINLLPFAIDNQRQPKAILEDKHNKPWRTMPSGRMSETQAKTLMLVLYPVAFCASLWLGGVRQCLTLMVLGYGYNDLNLADWSWVSRNAINALGFCCFASGALEVALNAPLSREHRIMLEWLGIIAAVVFTTVQTQDMADQVGDRMRGRRSLPLSVGDGMARWLTATPMMIWSVVCPLYWGVSIGLHTLVGALGLGIACRTVAFRSVEADKRTFRLWNAWMACLYALPLLASMELHRQPFASMES